MSRIRLGMVTTALGAILLSGCSSVEFGTSRPKPPGYGPFMLVIGQEPTPVYSVPVWRQVPLGGLVGLGYGETLLSLEPPARRLGWLSHQYRNAETWQIISSPGQWRTLTIGDVLYAAADTRYSAEPPMYGTYEWWLVSVNPVRLVLSQLSTEQELTYEQKDGYTEGMCWLVSQSDVGRNIKAVATYSGYLYRPSDAPKKVKSLEADKFHFEVVQSPETIGTVMERLSGDH